MSRHLLDNDPLGARDHCANLATPVHCRSTVRTVDEVTCPDCGGHLSTAVGFGWQRDYGQMLPWVAVCVSCTRRTGIDWTFGIDESWSNSNAVTRTAPVLANKHEVKDEHNRVLDEVGKGGGNLCGVPQRHVGGT